MYKVKVVDIAEEIYAELGQPSDLSIPAVTYWVRANVGTLNNRISTSFFVDETTLEIKQYEKNDSTTKEITSEESSIFKKMYMLHFYDGKLRSNLTTLGTDTVLSVSDDGSSVTKVNRNEINRVIYQIRKQESLELDNLIAAYKSSKASPVQVAGNDTNEPKFALTSYNRIG